MIMVTGSFVSPSIVIFGFPPATIVAQEVKVKTHAAENRTLIPQHYSLTLFISA